MRLVVLLGLLLPALGHAEVADHLKCYKVKDSLAKKTYTADLGGLVAEPGCKIIAPAAMACVPATKTNVAPAPPGGGGTGTPNNFFCYKVKCAKATLPEVTGTDQFGSHTAAPQKVKLLCAPVAGPSTTTTTTTPSTTTTSTTLASGGCSLPATGQTTCWDGNGSVVSCPGTGQDGDFAAGSALSYIDNGDGTVTDVNTGLMWEKLADDSGIHSVNTYFLSWFSALHDHVQTLNTMAFAGYTDWRLPNVRELQSIVDYGNHDPTVASAFNNNCVPGCAVQTCSCTGLAYAYWSSTSDVSAPTSKFTVFFGNGTVFTLNETYIAFGRAVRGGHTVRCTTPFTSCGSCGNGICVYNCPGTALVCAANEFVGQCTTNADCQGSPNGLCAGDQPACLGGPSGCTSLCP